MKIIFFYLFKNIWLVTVVWFLCFKNMLSLKRLGFALGVFNWNAEIKLFCFAIRMLEKRSLSYVDGPIPVPNDDPFLMENVHRIRICDTGIFYFFSCLLLSFFVWSLWWKWEMRKVKNCIFLIDLIVKFEAFSLIIDYLIFVQEFNYLCREDGGL